MSFSSLIESMDRMAISTFRRTDPKTGQIITVTLHSRSGAPDCTVDAVVKNPVMEEDYVPGSNLASEGTGVLILFLHPAIEIPVAPVKGDTASYGGSDYNVDRVAVDREGGTTLYMRKRSQRWDQ